MMENRERKWEKENPEKIIEASRAYYWKNKKEILAKNKVRRDKPENRVRERGRNKLKKRKLRATSPAFRLNDTISRGVRLSLKGKKNQSKWETLAGYTIEELMSHLAKNFKEGMSFENHGEWHIDHIIPISAFNFSTAEHEDFKRCWALSNLQPLWAGENCRKNSRLDKPFQPMLELTV